MTMTAMIAYAAALLVDVATPGPAMFGVISTGLARGTSAAIAVGFGLALGDILLVSVALLGLVAIAATFGWVFAWGWLLRRLKRSHPWLWVCSLFGC